MFIKLTIIFKMNEKARDSIFLKKISEKETHGAINFEYYVHLLLKGETGTVFTLHTKSPGNKAHINDNNSETEYCLSY